MGTQTADQAVLFLNLIRDLGCYSNNRKIGKAQIIIKRFEITL